MITKNMQKIFDIGLVPLISLEDANDAVPLGKALVAAGVPIAEITFRTAAGSAAIEKAVLEVPELLVGAGTIHDIPHAKEAFDKGAKFIVTPSFNREVIDWCLGNGIDIIPGTATPVEVEEARALGLKTCKFFPAEAYGGTKTLKALAGPFADIKFMPTGGVNENNMLDYLSLTNVAAIGGSFMAPEKLIEEKNWSAITAASKAVVKKMLGFELGHIGIHAQDANNANQIATALSDMFLQEKIEFPGAYFAGSLAEIVKTPFFGDKGHICIDTIDMERALAYFSNQKISFKEDSWIKDENGNVKVVYLQEQVGGFSIHLRKKQ